MTDTPEDIDILAAEYVLGALGPEDRARAEVQLRREPAFSAAVAAWELRLSGLNDGFAEVPAPDLMPGIEARLFGKPARKPAFWTRLALGGALAASVLLAVVVMTPPRHTLGTTLTADAQLLRFEATYADNALTVVRVSGSAAAAGSVHELWLIAGEAAPVSLGLMTSDTFEATLPNLAPGMVLAVSLEPSGGSTTGAPTGPVLVAGAVTDL
jgi:anti-sigma-K factor RskA